VQVRAIASGVNGGNERASEVTIQIHIKDVNHYTPQFTQQVSNIMHSKIIKFS
jgi:hypothetical protein